jgi:hypothetical protein
MATPYRLIELECPGCRGRTWVIDADYRGADGRRTDYETLDYTCRRCAYHGAQWRLGQKSPPTFLSQPHPLYPMTQRAFDYWVGILREHFPEYRRLAQLGTGFRPCLPEEADAHRLEHFRHYPIVEMRDPHGERRHGPFSHDVEVIRTLAPGDWITLTRYDGPTLHIERRDDDYLAAWRDAAGAVTAERGGLDLAGVLAIARRALEADLTL